MPKYACSVCGKIVLRSVNNLTNINPDKRSFCEQTGTYATLKRLRIRRRKKIRTTS